MPIHKRGADELAVCRLILIDVRMRTNKRNRKTGLFLRLAYGGLIRILSGLNVTSYAEPDMVLLVHTKKHFVFMHDERLDGEAEPVMRMRHGVEYSTTVRTGHFPIFSVYYGCLPLPISPKKGIPMPEATKKIKKVVVNRDLCIAAASCIVNAPGVFELDGESKAVIIQKGGVKNSGPAERTNFEDGTVDDATIMNAAQSCPTKAISVFAEDGTQLYP